MSGLFETVLVEAGRVRLLARHLARLRAGGVADEAIAEVAAILHARCASGEAPTVYRLDVADAGVTATGRAPRPPSRTSLRSVVAYDPADRSREQKRCDRAWADAAEAEAGGEALLVSADGFVGETTRANVFAILGRTVVTPRVAGILPGVTRGWAIETAGAVERPLTVAELRRADGVFLTTAARGVVPVRPHHRIDALAAAWRAL